MNNDYWLLILHSMYICYVNIFIIITFLRLLLAAAALVDVALLLPPVDNLLMLSASANTCAFSSKYVDAVIPVCAQYPFCWHKDAVKSKQIRRAVISHYAAFVCQCMIDQASVD
jgi:hypothetical protein